MNIYNTYTNKIEKFVPIENNKVKIYVCGPTVYNYIHIGNTRPIVVFDVLARYFKSKKYDVIFVQNFTDIDDKIINKAKEEKCTIDDISNKYIDLFLKDIKDLNLIDGIIRPRVTDNLENIRQMIRVLMKKGYAYQLNGDILFSVTKFKDYGKLSNQILDELKTGVRIEQNTSKNNSADFVLWKAKKENEPAYDFEYGQGRPGWHIECSAMIKEYLGEYIDIHAGGKDLIFPHHENEIAQSVCSSDVDTKFVNYWMHNGYITINDEKMSKSLGNFMLLNDVLKKYDGNVIRYFILQTHYRKDMNFSYEELNNAKKSLENISKNVNKFRSLKTQENEQLSLLTEKFLNEFYLAIEDDINTPKAVSSVFTYIKNINKIYNENDNFNLAHSTIKYVIEDILGVKLMENNVQDNKLLDLIKDIRNKLRENKQYELADEIRNRLNELGIDINDRKN